MYFVQNDLRRKKITCVSFKLCDMFNDCSIQVNLILRLENFIHSLLVNFNMRNCLILMYFSNVQSDHKLSHPIFRPFGFHSHYQILDIIRINFTWIQTKELFQEIFKF